MIDAATLALFGDNDSLMVQMLLPAGLVLITIALFPRLRKRRRSADASGEPITAREQVERYRQEKAVRGDMETLMVEIEELARRMSAQLDAKAVQLDLLIRQADERLAQIGRATGDAAPPGMGAGRSPGLDPPDAFAAGDGNADDSTNRLNTPNVDDPLARRVCELADQGLAPIDIARRLNEQVGKIELILALRGVGG